MIKKIHVSLAGFMLMAFLLGGVSAFAQVSASGTAEVSVDNVSSTISYEAEVKPVKFFERLTLLLTFNQEKRARLLEDFSKRNFELAKEKISEGKTAEADVFFQKSDKDISRATLSVSRIKDVEVRNTAFARLSDMSSVRAVALADVQARVENPIAKEAIGRAILKQEDMKASLDVKINKSNETAGNRGGNGIGISAVNPACAPTTTPYIKVLSPNGGEEYVVGEQITVTWEKCNSGSGSQVMIILKSTQTNFGAEIATVPNTGSASITLPSVLGGGQSSVISGSYYKIRLEVGGNAMGAQVPYADESDNLFKIGEASSENESVCDLNVEAGDTISLPFTITGETAVGQGVDLEACPLNIVFEGQLGAVKVYSTSGAYLNSWAPLMVQDFEYQAGTYDFSGTLNISGAISSGQNVILRFTKEDPSGALPVSFDIPVTIQ